MSPVEVLMEALNICGQEGYFEPEEISAAQAWVKERDDGD